MDKSHRHTYFIQSVWALTLDAHTNARARIERERAREERRANIGHSLTFHLTDPRGEAAAPGESGRNTFLLSAWGGFITRHNAGEEYRSHIHYFWRLFFKTRSRRKNYNNRCGIKWESLKRDKIEQHTGKITSNIYQHSYFSMVSSSSIRFLKDWVNDSYIISLELCSSCVLGAREVEMSVIAPAWSVLMWHIWCVLLYIMHHYSSGGDGDWLSTALRDLYRIEVLARALSALAI